MKSKYALYLGDFEHHFTQIDGLAHQTILKSTHVTPAQFLEKLRASNAHLSQISHLTLSDFTLDDNLLQCLTALWSRLSLTSLQIRDIKFADTSKVLQFAALHFDKQTGGTVNIHVGRVEGGKHQAMLHQHDYAILVEALLQKPLRHLYLYGGVISPAGIVKLEKALVNPLCQLQTLCLHFSEYSSVDYADFILILANALKNNTHLTDLILDGGSQQCSTQALQALQETLRNQNKTLTSLRGLHDQTIQQYIERNKLNGHLLQTKKRQPEYLLQCFSPNGGLREERHTTEREVKAQFKQKHGLRPEFRKKIVYASESKPLTLTLKCASLLQALASEDENLLLQLYLQAKGMRTKTTVYQKPSGQTWRIKVTHPDPALINPDSETWPSYQSKPHTSSSSFGC